MSDFPSIPLKRLLGSTKDMVTPGYIEVKIENISLFNYNFIVLLRHGQEEDVLPICIGAAEAHSIAAAFNNQDFPRPLTHDLLKSILGELECTVEKIEVCDLQDGTFFARLHLNKDGNSFDVDSRPSDAIAVALRYDAPIYVREDILRDNAVSIHQTSAETQEKASPAPASSMSKRERLQHDLEQAVSAEKYERAAELRDEIDRLEKDN